MLSLNTLATRYSPVIDFPKSSKNHAVLSAAWFEAVDAFAFEISEEQKFLADERESLAWSRALLTGEDQFYYDENWQEAMVWSPRSCWEDLEDWESRHYDD